MTDFKVGDRVVRVGPHRFEWHDEGKDVWGDSECSVGWTGVVVNHYPAGVLVRWDASGQNSAIAASSLAHLVDAPPPPLHTFEFVVTVQAANRQAAEETLSTLPDDVAVKEVVA